MRGRAAFSLAVALAAGLACSGAVEQARLAKEGLMPGENRKACAAWVEHVNGLDACLGVVYETDNLCGGIDDVGVDMTPWFECLEVNTHCEADRPLTNWEACPPPLRSSPGAQG